MNAATAQRTKNSNLATNFETQCLQGKYFGCLGKSGGTYRCQLKRGHVGSHVDTFGRSWPLSKREIRQLRESFKPVKQGVLEVGNDGREVVINHPSLQTDSHGNGFITFSPEQARNLAALLIKNAEELEGA
jgi:hypothetical protein